MASENIDLRRVQRLEAFVQAILGLPLEALDDERLVNAVAVQYRFPWSYGEYGQRLTNAIEELAAATQHQSEALRAGIARDREEAWATTTAMESILERLAHSVQALSAASERTREFATEIDRIRADVSAFGDRSRADLAEVLVRMDEVEIATRFVTGELRDVVSPYIAGLSMGIELDRIPVHRVIPVRVYLSEGSDAAVNNVSDSLEAFLDTLSFEASSEFPPERGSFYKKWFAKSMDVLTHPEVTERLMKGERALELEYLHIKQAEADKNQAEGAAALISALQAESEAVVQVGSILIIKARGHDAQSRTIVRTLTQSEIAALERQPDVLRSPSDIIGFLRECGAGHVQSASVFPPAAP